MSNQFLFSKNTMKPTRFLQREILDAIVALRAAYEYMIEKHPDFHHTFAEDVKPLTEIVRNLFQSINKHERFELFNRFYSKFFNFSSVIFRNCN